jgi:uncharacterized membrane protein YidH (DUF202 family)
MVNKKHNLKQPLLSATDPDEVKVIVAGEEDNLFEQEVQQAISNQYSDPNSPYSDLTGTEDEDSHTNQHSSAHASNDHKQPVYPSPPASSASATSSHGPLPHSGSMQHYRLTDAEEYMEAQKLPFHHRIAYNFRDFFHVVFREPLTNDDLSLYGSGIKQMYKAARLMPILFLLCGLISIPSLVENITAYNSAAGQSLFPRNIFVELSSCSARTLDQPRLFLLSFIVTSILIFAFAYWARFGLTSRPGRFLVANVFTPIAGVIEDSVVRRVTLEEEQNFDPASSIISGANNNSTNNGSVPVRASATGSLIGETCTRSAAPHKKPRALSSYAEKFARPSTSTHSALQQHTVMVRDLPRNLRVSTTELAEFFSSCGEVMRVSVILGSRELHGLWSRRENIANNLAKYRLARRVGRRVKRVGKSVGQLVGAGWRAVDKVLVQRVKRVYRQVSVSRINHNRSYNSTDDVSGDINDNDAENEQGNSEPTKVADIKLTPPANIPPQRGNPSSALSSDRSNRRASIRGVSPASNPSNPAPGASATSQTSDGAVERKRRVAHRYANQTHKQGTLKKTVKELEMMEEISEIDRNIYATPRLCSGVAFITFRTPAQAQFAAKQFHSTSLARNLWPILTFLCCSAVKNPPKFRDQHSLVVKPAPEASDLLFWNLGAGEIEKILRRTATFLIAAGVGIAVFCAGVATRDINQNSQSIGLHYILPVIFAVSKQLVFAIYRYLSEFERHHQRSTLQKSLLFRIFFTQVLLSIVSSCLVVLYDYFNAPGYNNNFEAASSCQYTADLSNILAVSLLIEAVLTPLLGYLRLPEVWEQQYIRNSGVESVIHNNSLPFTLELHQRYLSLLWFFFLTAWYSQISPILYFLGAFGSAANYCVDKYNLLRTDQYIPRYDSVLSHSAAIYLMWTLLWSQLQIVLSGLIYNNSASQGSTLPVLSVFFMISLCSLGLFYLHDYLRPFVMKYFRKQDNNNDVQLKDRELISLTDMRLAYIPDHAALHDTLDLFDTETSLTRNPALS